MFDTIDEPACQSQLDRLRDQGIIVYNLGGSCPLQGEGSITHDSGKRVLFYFRARGQSWTMEIGRRGREMADDAWKYRESWPGDKYAAGYMVPRQALPLIERAVLFWRKDGAPLNRGHDLEKILAHLGKAYREIETLGFQGWYENTGNRERDLFRTLHGFGTEAEDEVENLIGAYMTHIWNSKTDRCEGIDETEDKKFTKWLLERRDTTINAILEMQR